MKSQRSAQITSIIEKRRPLAKKIAVVESNLKSLDVALRNLETQRDRIKLQIDDPNIIAHLQEIDFSDLHIQLITELETLAKLKARFSRDTLNIGVVGRARQGKSRLLQSLTGLTTAEIPDGDRQHCTGVRSTIYHDPQSETSGEVYFHSERSFLDEVIIPYYEQLRLGAKPNTLDDFANKPFPALPNQLSVQAESGAKYEHLRRYYKNLDQYRPLLRSAAPRQISKNEIREYVAQDTPDGQRVFFNYLAVREVKIICSFPNPDIGQIALVDMPGLGDTGIGDQERLIQTLGQDVDLILFVRMPKSSGDYWADVDVQLYDTAGAALIDLPVNLWSLMILNQTSAGSNNGNNSHNCYDLADSLVEKHINVISCIIANCAESEEVQLKILDPALDYLAIHITTLDQQYATACQAKLMELQNAIKVKLDLGIKVLGIMPKTGSDFPLFIKLFNQLWSEITSSLERLLKKLGEQRNTQDEDFKHQVELALATCQSDPGIPDLEQIEIRRDRVGGYPIAYYEYLNEIRAHLSQRFLSLDEGLKLSIQRVKSQVADVLIHQGRLGRLSAAQGAEFLEAIVQQIPDHLHQLKLGCQIISDFNLSYRGLIQHRIRQHLDGLTPDRTELKLSKSPSAAEVLNCLKVSHGEAVYKCQNALEDLLGEPSQAAFAIVEEFVDRILRAEDVKIEWQIFLEEMRSEIWPTEFQQWGDRTKIHQDWLNSVEQVKRANQTEYLQFLN